MFIDNKYYSLKNINLNKNDDIFMNVCIEYANKFPNRWVDLIENVLSNELITYYKDTTAIIQINNLNKNTIEFLFKYIKTLLNNNIVIKVIYKKEFIIIHFKNGFHIDLVKYKDMLYCIPLYKCIIKNNINDFKIYFYCILKVNNYSKVIPFVIKYHDKIFLFDNCPSSDIKLNNIEVIYLYKVKKRGYQMFRCLQIWDNTSITFDNLYKLII